MRRAVLSFALILGACGGEDPPDPCVDAPTYTNDIAPLIADHCLACHDEAKVGAARNGAPAERNFNDFDLLEPHIADVADVITSGRMPPATATVVEALTSEDRSLVADWRSCDYPR